MRFKHRTHYKNNNKNYNNMNNNFGLRRVQIDRRKITQLMCWVEEGSKKEARRIRSPFQRGQNNI